MQVPGCPIFAFETCAFAAGPTGDEVVIGSGVATMVEALRQVKTLGVHGMARDGRSLVHGAVCQDVLIRQRAIAFCSLKSPISGKAMLRWFWIILSELVGCRRSSGLTSNSRIFHHFVR